MSRDASVSFAWGDDEHRFRLPIGGLRELQEKLGASPFAVLERLREHRPMVDDAREVLRIGLVGAGMAPTDALALVRRHADERPLAESRGPAIIVLAAALYGVADETPGKSAAGSTEPTTPPAA